jgi:hypothetical protein
MQRVEFGIYCVLCDVEATRQAYEQIAEGAPEACCCLACRNFVAVREQVYPAGFRALLRRLGIDYRREAEIYLDGPTGAGLYHYEGWFHFVGEVTQRLDAWEQVDDHFHLWFSAGGSLLPDLLKGQPVGQLDFRHDAVPWVLDTPTPF